MRVGKTGAPYAAIAPALSLETHIHLACVADQGVEV